ncbi:hypothetical protein [Dialister invisus]|uniref:hypothetical protein n=1 Tax=Dialister invisus TaxID=218538 RepID=UPI003999896D
MCWSKIVTIGIIAAGIALFSGCGEKTEKMQVSEALLPKPVSIVNFTFDGSPSKLTFSKVPQRVIVTRPEILDVLICLGSQRQGGCCFFSDEYERQDSLL